MNFFKSKNAFFKTITISVLVAGALGLSPMKSHAHESLTAHAHDEEEKMPQVMAPIFGQADTAEPVASGLTAGPAIETTGNPQIDSLLNLNGGSASPKFGQMPANKTETKRIYRTQSTRDKIYHKGSRTHLHGVEMPQRSFNTID